MRLVVRNSETLNAQIPISPETISQFAADNGIGDVLFLDQVFPKPIPLLSDVAIEDADNVVRRLRLDGGDVVVPASSPLVPSVSGQQLIQLRPSALTGVRMLVAGAVGEQQIETLSGQMPLWQAYATTISANKWRTLSPLSSLILALTVFIALQFWSRKLILATCASVLAGFTVMWQMAWLPPFDPISAAMFGGLFLAVLSHNRAVISARGSKLTSLETRLLGSFTERSVGEFDCLASWVSLYRPSKEGTDGGGLTVLCAHGDTGAMSEVQMAKLLSKQPSVESKANPWSVYTIESPRELGGALFLITQPNDHHNRQSVTKIASMIATFCVTDPEPNDPQRS